MGFHRQRTMWLWRNPDSVTNRQLLSIDQIWQRSTVLTWGRWGCRPPTCDINCLQVPPLVPWTVKLWYPLTMPAIPERLRDGSCIGAIQIDITSTFTLHKILIKKFSESRILTQLWEFFILLKHLRLQNITSVCWQTLWDRTWALGTTLSLQSWFNRHYTQVFTQILTRFIHIRIHENTTISYFVDVLTSIRDLHQKKLVLILLVLDMTWTWLSWQVKFTSWQEPKELVPASSSDEGLW